MPRLNYRLWSQKDVDQRAKLSSMNAKIESLIPGKPVVVSDDALTYCLFRRQIAPCCSQVSQHLICVPGMVDGIMLSPRKSHISRRNTVYCDQSGFLVSDGPFAHGKIVASALIRSRRWGWLLQFPGSSEGCWRTGRTTNSLRGMVCCDYVIVLRSVRRSSCFSRGIKGIRRTAVFCGDAVLSFVRKTPKLSACYCRCCSKQLGTCRELRSRVAPSRMFPRKFFYLLRRFTGLLQRAGADIMLAGAHSAEGRVIGASVHFRGKRDDFFLFFRLSFFRFRREQMFQLILPHIAEGRKVLLLCIMCAIAPLLKLAAGSIDSESKLQGIVPS